MLASGHAATRFWVLAFGALSLVASLIYLNSRPRAAQAIPQIPPIDPKLCLTSEEDVIVSVNASALTIHITSNRSQCRLTASGPSEACVFRAYARGEAFLSADYCSPIKHSNGTYQCSLAMAGGASARVLVVLESLANSSDFGLPENPAWGAVAFNLVDQCVGVAVFDQEVVIDQDPVALLPLVRDLRPCSYQEANVAKNDFIWIAKQFLHTKGFTLNDALFVPQSLERRMPVQQEFVWFPRGCRQTFVSRESLQAVGEGAGGMDVVFAGTSRVSDAFDTLSTFYQNLGNSVKFFIGDLHVWTPHQVHSEMHRVLSLEPWPTICPPGGASTKNHRLLVIVLSDGIWAARGHENFGYVKDVGMFRYYDNFLVRLDAIRDLCRNRRLKIVLATQPQIHAWDGRTSKGSGAIFPRALATLGPRMQVVNWAIRKVAREQGLLLADLGGASDARRDAVLDNRHYDAIGSGRNMSLGVTVTFAQLMLAAALEAANARS